jgi:membrane protease YdiL (CAAX protease family)
MSESGRRVEGAPAPGLGWGWRATIFVLLFLLLALALTQLVVLLGAPLTPTLSWWSVTPMLLAALGASWVAMRRFEGYPLRALGLPLAPSGAGQFFGGTAVGVCLIGGVILLFVLLGWLRWVPAGAGLPVAAWAGLASVLAAAAFTEELLFRGYAFRLLAGRYGGGVAIAVTAPVFAALHLANPNSALLPILNIGLAGMLLGLAYWRTLSLWYATGVHFGWNVTMGFADLSVSGLDMGIPGYDPELAGPDLWTGGNFGPEGGLLVTFAAAAGILWLWRTKRLVRISDTTGWSNQPQP